MPPPLYLQTIVGPDYYYSSMFPHSSKAFSSMSMCAYEWNTHFLRNANVFSSGRRYFPLALFCPQGPQGTQGTQGARAYTTPQVWIPGRGSWPVLWAPAIKVTEFGTKSREAVPPS